MKIKNLIFGSLAYLFALSTFASAPMSTTGQIGYYRTHLGAFEITTISDGTLVLVNYFDQSSVNFL
jgi:hypothetical protein